MAYPENKHNTRRHFIRTALSGSGGLWIAGQTLPFQGKHRTIGDKPGRYSRIAIFQETTATGARCLTCPNECDIDEGSVGICGTRRNYGGKIYSLAYGNPCAVHIDPIEKKPLYHFYPQTTAFSIATAGCNFSCLNCQNWTISQTTPDKTRNADLMPEMVVKEALANQCKSIAYTYSEPTTFYEYVFDTARMARLKGIRNVYKSNGFIQEAPLRELAHSLDAANIDLKSFSNEIYVRLSGGTLEPVLRTLRILKEMNVWLEITNLIIPGWTDDMAIFRKMCIWLRENGLQEAPLHISRFQPEYKLTRVPPTPLAILDKAREIAMDEGLHFVYIGNVLNTPAENTYCAKCKKVIIGRKGYRILSNAVTAGRCSFCNEPVPGRWQ